MLTQTRMGERLAFGLYLAVSLMTGLFLLCEPWMLPWLHRQVSLPLPWWGRCAMGVVIIAGTVVAALLG